MYSTKICFTGPTNNNYVINNFKIIILHEEDIIDIIVKKIYCKNKIELHELKVVYDDSDLSIDCVHIIGSEQPVMSIIFSGIQLRNPEFMFQSGKINYRQAQDLTTVSFDRTHSSNVLPMINYIGSMINRIKKKVSDHSRDDLTHNQIIVFNIYRSDGIYIYSGYKFGIQILQATINLTTKTASNIVSNITMNNYLLASTNIQTLSENKTTINSLRINLDPEIFDQINYLIGTLTLNTDITHVYNQNIPQNVLDKIQEALSNSIMSDSINDLEDHLDTITSNLLSESTDKIIFPIVNILTESIDNLRSIILDDYQNNDTSNTPNDKFTINIDSTHINLFEKMNETPKPFSHIIIKKTQIICLTKTIQEINMNPVIQSDNYKRTNIQTSYKLYIDKMAIIDTMAIEPEWKYFIKLPQKAINIHVILFNDLAKAYVQVSPIVINIREETLIKLLAFISNSYQMPSHQSSQSSQSSQSTQSPPNPHQILIEKFILSEINAVINYYPIIFKKFDNGSSNLTIRDFKLNFTLNNL